MWQSKENEFAKMPAATRPAEFFVVLLIFLPRELSFSPSC
jgi:hypothetical protein